MPRINQLHVASSVAQTDVVAVDTENGTKCAPKSTLFDGYYTAAEVDAAIAQSTANTSLTEQVTLSSGYDTSVFDSVAYRIASGTVLVYVVVKAGLPAGWYNDKATGLPSKIKPYMQVMGSHRIASAADAAKDIFASLNTDSTVQVYISAATNAAVAFTFTYPFG